MKKLYPLFLVLGILFLSLTAACGKEATEAEIQQHINEETTNLLQIVDDCLRTEFDEYQGDWSEDSLNFCQDLLLAENGNPPVGVICDQIWSPYAYECDYVNRGWTYTRILHAYAYNIPEEDFEFTLTNVPLTDGSTVLYMSIQMATYVEENTTYYLDRQGIASICNSGIGCIQRGDPQLSVMLNYYNHNVPQFNEIAPTGWIHLLTYRLNNHCDSFTESGLRFQRYEHENCYFSDN